MCILLLHGIITLKLEEDLLQFMNVNLKHLQMLNDDDEDRDRKLFLCCYKSDTYNEKGAKGVRLPTGYTCVGDSTDD